MLEPNHDNRNDRGCGQSEDKPGQSARDAVDQTCVKRRTGAIFMGGDPSDQLEVFHVFVAQNAEQSLGRYGPNEPVVSVDHRNSDHVEPHCQGCNLFLIGIQPDGLVFWLHDVANPNCAVSEQIVDPNDTLQSPGRVGHKHCIRAFEKRAAQRFDHLVHRRIKEGSPLEALARRSFALHAELDAVVPAIVAIAA